MTSDETRPAVRVVGRQSIIVALRRAKSTKIIVDMNDLSTFKAFAEHLADLARPIAQRYFRADRATLGQIDKADATPVTLADMEIEQHLRDAIVARFPAHGILGEEHESRNAGADWTWVIDPIDGTKAFTCGKPQFGTLIALAHRGVPVVGVIDQPITGERWTGVKGAGSWFNGQSVRVNAEPKPLRDTIVLVTTPDQFTGAGAAAFERLKCACKGVYYGGDCYNYALIAAGQVDLVVEMGLKTVDFAALINPIEEAGGVCLDWAGQPLTLASDGTIVAAASRPLATEVLRVLEPRA